MPPDGAQLDLFAAGTTGSSATPPLGAANVPESVEAVARRLPEGVRLGTSSWSFPGWEGIVYDREASPKLLAREGLSAYAAHPLLRAVSLDRTYYAPIPEDAYAEYARRVPDDFRFLVKAPELTTLARFPQHSRYGANRGLDNPRWLDPAFAINESVGPAVAGLGPKLGAIVFQFPPQSTHAAGDGPTFADALHGFLAALPKGPLYAVEIRTVDWLTPEYREALVASGAVHCITVHPRMPAPEEQARRACGPDDPALIARWMLRGAQSYDDAKSRYAPFDRLQEPDPKRRASLADLVARTVGNGRPATVTINNKAEGCAPLSAVELAAAIAERVTS
jgi:uncharacterized protein YecE (DUF72 family)